MNGKKLLISLQNLGLYILWILYCKTKFSATSSTKHLTDIFQHTQDNQLDSLAVRTIAVFNLQGVEASILPLGIGD